ncbi:MAG: ATP-binding protein [Alphaproteobacteria bacterium]
MLLLIVLLLTLLGSLGLALLLSIWAERIAGTRLLVGFLLGVCAWILGNELPNWAGPETIRLALSLLSSAPFTAAIFLHFAVRFAAFTQGQWLLPWSYALAAATSLLALIVLPGRFELLPDFSWVARPNALGLVAYLIWGFLALAGMAILLRQGLRAEGLIRRQALAVAFASAWGAVCMLGYGMMALGSGLFPWPLLGLPLFPVFLVYAVLRYHVLAASIWARRGLVWTGLMAAAALVAAAVSGISFLAEINAWLSTMLVASTVVILGGPMRRLAERLVYPGGDVSTEELSRWRHSLARCSDQVALAHHASSLISNKLNTPICVQIDDKPKITRSDHPALICKKAEDGSWQTEFTNWDGAPPGPKQLALLFGNLLAEEAERLIRAEERSRLEAETFAQARLVELGSLATTIAHDIRNPLNAIAMAAATAAPETRQEIREQINRISRLSQDLMEYSKPWQIDAQNFDLRELVYTEFHIRNGIILGPGLHQPLIIRADRRRLLQALVNIIDNALAAPARTKVEVNAEILATGMLRLTVSDDGAGVPAELKNRLFQPFVSLRPGGTGLGLAIVAKIAQAHGGSAQLLDHPNWSTCFAIDLSGAFEFNEPYAVGVSR